MSQLPLPLDTTRIRAQFPAFSEPSLDGQAFFDNAGGSYTARPVLHRLDHYYRATKIQPYGVYAASQEAGKAMDFAYERIAMALNVTPAWLHFGPSTSANTYTLAHAFAGRLNPGDAIIVTDQDHEANSGAWRRLAVQGVEIREWSVDKDTGRLALSDLQNLLDDKVRIVAVTHCSNIAAEINPVAEIAALAKAAGAVSVIDGVAFAPHGLPDIEALGCDIYLFSAYKTYGPHQGIMAIRPSLAADLPNQGHFFNEGVARKRLTPAGPDHAQIAACAGIVNYLETVAEIAGKNVTGKTPFQRAHTAMRQQETTLLAPLLGWLKGRNTIRLIGPDDPELRAPTVSLALSQPGGVVAQRLAKHGIMASGGNFYAYRLMQALGIDPDHGVLRLSFLHYTSPDEIARLIAALDAELV